MNYTQSKQIIYILEQILKNVEFKTFNNNLLAKNITKEIEARLATAVKQKSSDASWATTNSEWDFIHALKGIVRILDTVERDSKKQHLHEMLNLFNERIPPIKVVFFTQEYYLWPSFQTIWEYLQTVENCHTKIVFAYSLRSLGSETLTNGISKKNLSEYLKHGYPILESKDFNLETECPDVIFYMKPYYELRSCPTKFYVNEIEKHTPYTVFVSYCLDVQGGSKLHRYFYALPAFYHMWRIVGYSTFYIQMMMKYGYRNGNNVIRIGHPKFDNIYKVLKQREYINETWSKKIDSRPVVLWNSHFSVAPGKGVGTYFTWKETIFNYFNQHKDIVLLWRPHPIFWDEIRKQPGFNASEFDQFIKTLKDSDNIIVDDTPDYRFSFSMSNALISDAATFLVEYGISGQPVLYTPKINGEYIINNDYLIGMQIGTNENDIISFLERIRIQDIKNNSQTQKHFRALFGEYDGKNGQRICTKILKDVESDCVRRARLILYGEEAENNNDVE